MDFSDGDDGSSGDEQNPLSNFESASENKKLCRRHTPHQIQKLEAFFKECPHPDEAQRKKLGRELNLEQRQIKFWFQNKRTQIKAQNDRADNMALRAENERIQCENHAIMEALKNVICPACGGPPFGEEQRRTNAQKLRIENAHLKEELDKISNLLSKYVGRPLPLIDSLASVQPIPPSPTFNLYPPPKPTLLDVPSSSSHTNDINNLPNNNSAFSEQNAVAQIPTTHQQQLQSQLQPLSDLERAMMTNAASTAMEELQKLSQVDEPLWVKSLIDGRSMIDRDGYEKFSQRRHSHFKSSSARVESSKETGVVAIDAIELVRMFLDPEKWMEIFPTIVSRAKTIHLLVPGVPEGCLQLMYEHMHIVSPLVPPREFVILRYCEKIEDGVWAIADVSYYLKDIDFPSSSYCWKRPSGCIIQDLSGGLSKVTWIEHVEVDDKSHTHRLYRDLLCGGSAYGAHRWIVTLDRMSQRLSLSDLQSNPSHDFFRGEEGRKSMMNLGQRMVKSFTGMLSMSGKLDFPQMSEVHNSGVRVSIRKSTETGQPSGVIVSAASSLWLPLPPPLVFAFFADSRLRHQWDVLCHGNAVEEVARIACGADERNRFSVFRPYIPTESGMLVLQESFIDALGGMVVYAPIDAPSMAHVATTSAEDSSTIPILPSGFIISCDGHPTTAAAVNGNGTTDGAGGSLLTVAFQILVSGPSYTKDLNMESVATVNTLITSTIQRIKAMLNCSDID